MRIIGHILKENPLTTRMWVIPLPLVSPFPISFPSLGVFLFCVLSRGGKEYSVVLHIASSGYQARHLWIDKYTLCATLHKLTSVYSSKGVFAHGNTVYIILFPSSGWC